MRFTIIVPVRGHPDTLSLCLGALAAASRPDDERIVVDDGMDPEAARCATGSGFVVVRNARRGVSAARNTGARAAGGELLLFVDSDVLIDHRGIERIRDAFDDPGLQAVVAAASADCPLPNFASRYKNLWMRHTYLARRDGVSLFYTSAAAIRREAFRAAGGFDERYEAPSIEDTEIGFRLSASGARIRILDEAGPVHLKRYSLRSLLATDFRRSVALTRHVLRSRTARNLLDKTQSSSVPAAFQAGVVLAAAAVLAGIVSLAAGHEGTAFVLVLGTAAILAALNRGFLGYLLERQGLAFAIQAALLLPLEALVAAIGVAWGTLGYAIGKRY